MPRAYLQADLDIVTLPGSTPSETLLADAEVIRTVSEVSYFDFSPLQSTANRHVRLELFVVFPMRLSIDEVGCGASDYIGPGFALNAVA